VRSLLGNPRSYSGGGHWNYGGVWVMFESGIVKCLVKSNCFRGGNCRLHKDCTVK